MMGISGRNAARMFRKKFALLKPTLGEIREILCSQGYDIIEFNAIFNTEDVSTIIEELKLDSFIATQKGFTFINRNHRLVFVHEDLSEEEKLGVLLHEEGHIFCGHIEENVYMGRDVQQEMEANAFSYCLLNPGMVDRCNHIFRTKGKWLGLVAVLSLIVIGGCFLFERDQSTFGDYYITTSGNKYHQEGCIHIKNKTNIQRLTEEQFEAEEYKPCGVCLPGEL